MLIRGGVRVGFLDTWSLYVLLCSDGTYYTGVTTNTKRRLREHNATKRGAKYTRTRRPVKLVFELDFDGRSAVQKAEYKFKRLTREQKIATIKEYTEGRRSDWLQR